jgi:hypothetical protein
MIKTKVTSDSLQTIFNEGTRVGKEAQKLFPDGKVKPIIISEKLRDSKLGFIGLVNSWKKSHGRMEK